MAVTDEEVQRMRETVEAARVELEKVNADRIASEQATENDRVAQDLKAEYDRIQAAIAQAKGLNVKATDKPVQIVSEKAVTPPVVPTSAIVEGK